MTSRLGNPIFSSKRTTWKLLARLLEADPTRTLQEYADELGISRERVRQIIDKHGLQRRRIGPDPPR